MMTNRCPHNNVQQFTEICFDCGRGVYETDQEYLAHLEQELARRQEDETSRRIEVLEAKLGVRHPGNS